jgi:hypothetical protein
MSRNNRSKFTAVVLMGLALSAASAMARAEAKSAPQCKTAGNAAWYEAQRQLTDGHADPYVAAGSGIGR